MFPKKIIGRYIGNNPDGISIGHINLKPNKSIECAVTEKDYPKMIEYLQKGDIEIFEFVSLEELNDLDERLSLKLKSVSDVVNKQVSDINTNITNLQSELELKFSNATYEDEQLKFYSGKKILRSIKLPSPESPREIELSRDDTHLLWRIKPLKDTDDGQWTQLISLADITGPGINIVTVLENVSLLPEIGSTGDIYIIDGYTYVWDTILNEWCNVGPIVGIEGPQGPQGPQGEKGDSYDDSVLVSEIERLSKEVQVLKNLVDNIINGDTSTPTSTSVLGTDTGKYIVTNDGFGILINKE